MESLSNVYVLSLLSGLISCIVTFADAKIYNIDKSKNVYLKIFILSTLLSLIVLFISQNYSPGKLGVNQDILTGNPDF